MSGSQTKPSFLRQVVTYGGGMLLNYGIGFILLPVYTRLMPAEDFGVLEILGRTVEMVSMLLLAQFGITYIRFYRDKPEADYRARVTANCFCVTTAVSGALAALVAIFSGSLSPLLFSSSQYQPHIVLSAVRYFCETATLVPLLYFQASEQPGKFIVLSSLRFTTLLILNISFLYLFKDKVAAVLWANIVASLAFVLTAGIYVLIRASFAPDFPLIKQILKFSWSFTLVGAFGFVVGSGDRYVVNEYCGKAAVGVYSAAYKLGMLLNALIFSPIMRAWTPRLIDVIRDPNGGQKLARLVTLALFAYVSAGLAMSLFSRELVAIALSPAFYECYSLIPIIILAYAFDGITMFVDSGIYYSKKTHLKLWHSLTTLLCVGLYLWLIPKYCGLGAAWATVGTLFSITCLTWYLNQRILPIAYELRKMMLLLLFAVGGYLLSLYLTGLMADHLATDASGGVDFSNWGSLLLRFILNLLILGLFAGAVVLFRILEKEDISRLKGYYFDLKSKFSSAFTLE